MGEPEKAPGSNTDESGQNLTEPDQAGPRQQRVPATLDG